MFFRSTLLLVGLVCAYKLGVLHVDGLVHGVKFSIDFSVGAVVLIDYFVVVVDNGAGVSLGRIARPRVHAPAGATAERHVLGTLAFAARGLNSKESLQRGLDIVACVRVGFGRERVVIVIYRLPQLGVVHLASEPASVFIEHVGVPGLDNCGFRRSFLRRTIQIHHARFDGFISAFSSGRQAMVSVFDITDTFEFHDQRQLAVHTALLGDAAELVAYNVLSGNQTFEWDLLHIKAPLRDALLHLVSVLALGQRVIRIRQVMIRGRAHSVAQEGFSRLRMFLYRWFTAGLRLGRVREKFPVILALRRVCGGPHDLLISRGLKRRGFFVRDAVRQITKERTFVFGLLHVERLRSGSDRGLLGRHCLRAFFQHGAGIGHIDNSTGGVVSNLERFVLSSRDDGRVVGDHLLVHRVAFGVLDADDSVTLFRAFSVAKHLCHDGVHVAAALGFSQDFFNDQRIRGHD